MRLASLLLLALTACSYTSEGGITGRYESTSTSRMESAASSWDNSSITITSPGGSIRVVGVAGKTNLSIEARFVAGANSQEDADAAFADLAKNLVLEKRGGGWVVDCPPATSQHGSVHPASTGCTDLRIEVPAGSAVPLEIHASAPFGGVHVSGVTVKQLEVSAPFGIVADVVPADEADIRLLGENLVSGMCSTVLRVPSATSIEAASLSVDNPSVKYWLGTYVEGFADGPTVAPYTGTYAWHQGTAPFAAKSITLRASLGKALLTTAPVPAYDPRNQCLSRDLKIVVSGSAAQP
jgi:hypothetical protein